MESLDGVGGSTSIVDYLKQRNRSLNEGRRDQYALVDDSTTNAQLFLVYSASGDPTDFEEEIDYDYQRANIRVNLTSGWYSDNAPLVDAFQEYIDTKFNEPGLKATLSGRAMISHVWLGGIEGRHFRSIGIALVLILVMAIVVFRSVVAGVLTVIPVVSSILFIYGYLVVNGLSIGIGASMFASVAIGLGVDFAIHTIDRIREACAKNPDVDEALLSLYPHTGRALFFNLLTVSLGFGVLTTSEVVPLKLFGMIVALAVFTAFILSVTLLPALVKELKPRFI
ncbi:MAG: MMPL family transporter [bacterium]|nr:MMPL family transporter [bacterium]